MGPVFTAAEARALLGRVLALSTTKACEARLTGQERGHLRYAQNRVTTSGRVDDTTLSVEAHMGRRSGTASINQFDQASLERVVRQAEDLARLGPEDPEFVEFLGPQSYPQTDAWADRTAALTPASRARSATAGITSARERDVEAAGYWEDRAQSDALMNTAGLFAFHRDTELDFSVTARTTDGAGSGWASQHENDAAKLDVGRVSAIAFEKALASQGARPLEPGQYTVVLEPHASRPLIRNLVLQMDARLAEEGRSFLSRPGGGTRLGERVVASGVTIRSDPSNPLAPTSPWAPDGRPHRPVTWFEDGVVANLYASRFWAKHSGIEAIPRPEHIIVEGGSQSLEDIIRETERGILVTRTWYIRSVDPQTLLYTGLTRDGTFLIRDGVIRHAVKNFRFNESPIAMLKNVELLGRPVRTGTDLIPPMRVANFTFSSLSDAV